MKRNLFTLLAVIFATVAAMGATWSVSSIPNVQRADSTRFVSNPDAILSPSTVAAIDNTLRSLRSSSTVEGAVVVVDQIDRPDIETFANDLFDSWRIGRDATDNGFLLLVVKDMRRAVIRTGRGTETVLTSAMCGRILRDYMKPRFQQGDYDGGVIAGVDQVVTALSDPSAARLVASPKKVDLLGFLLSYLVVMVVIMIIAMLNLMRVNRKSIDSYDKYQKLLRLKPLYLALAVLGVGVPLIAYLMLRKMMHNVRESSRRCPNCGTAMNKLDEETDNLYLTPSQDFEEKINSVDYDVWLCPCCGEKDVLPFVNTRAQLSVCPSCSARACRLTATRIVTPATTRSEGKGEKIYSCLNCHKQHSRAFSIPREESGATIAGAIAGAAIGSTIGGRGGHGGGGFGGGSTGGGGASTGW